MRHESEPTHFHVTIGSHEPVLRIGDGDSVATWCVDSGGRDREGEQITDGGNPQTGPFSVEGAEPGDALSVRLDRLWPNRKLGVTAGIVAPNVVDPDFAATLSCGTGNDEHMWILDLERGAARLEKPPPGLERLGELPFEPMLGCFGVAPERGEATSSRHGGNMDCRGFGEGVTIYFPVFAEGTLFHLGDGHARQGDGEIVGTGIEVSFEVEFIDKALLPR